MGDRSAGLAPRLPGAGPGSGRLRPVTGRAPIRHGSWMDTREHGSDARGALVAVLAVLGPSLASGAARVLAPPERPLRVPVPSVRTLDAGTIARWGCGPRELRGLPGIGRTRAFEIARVRWRRGGVFELENWTSIRGIGAVTVGRCREFLAGGAED